MPKTTDQTVLRRCRYCRGKFRHPEKVRGGGEQLFCCPGHKDLYHRYGPMTFEGIFRRVVKQFNLPMDSEAVTELSTQIELLVDSRIYEAIKVFRMEEATRRMGKRHEFGIESADDTAAGNGAANLPALSS